MADRYWGTVGSGTVAADQDAVAATLGAWDAALLVAATGTLSGTLLFEGSADGTNWAAIQLAPVAAPSGLVSSAAVDGSGGAVTTAWSGSNAGFAQVRARLHPRTSGSATVTIRAA